MGLFCAQEGADRAVIDGWNETGAAQDVVSLENSMQMRITQLWWAVPMILGLTGCDQLGLETPAKTAERQIAEAKAIGGACRHALRAIEDCYILNTKADKSSVFAGWREMDEYMRENKLEGIAPVVPRPAPGDSKARAKQADAEEDAEDEVVVSESTSKPAASSPSSALDNKGGAGERAGPATSKTASTSAAPTKSEGASATEGPATGPRR